MRHVHICIGILFCLLFQQDINADTLYTWTAPEGTIHITKTKPPKNGALKDQLHYPSNSMSLPAPRTETSDPAKADDDTVLAAMQQAKQAREKAQKARRVAELAIEKANQLKQETEAFLEPWRNKRRIRRPMQLQIESRIQNTNQVIADAERLIARANDAEARAQAAEEKARHIQAQFLDAYRTIVSN